MGAYEGIYLCAPEHDAHSYLPSNRVREELEGKLREEPRFLRIEILDGV